MKTTLIGLAIHIVAALVIYQAHALDLGALLDDRGGVFNLQVFDQDHAVAVGQADAIFNG